MPAGDLNAALAERLVEAFGRQLWCSKLPASRASSPCSLISGPEIMLANVRLDELLRVEIYRRGLHSDAFSEPGLRPAENPPVLPGSVSVTRSVDVACYPSLGRRRRLDHRRDRRHQGHHDCGHGGGCGAAMLPGALDRSCRAARGSAGEPAAGRRARRQHAVRIRPAEQPGRDGSSAWSSTGP